MAMGFVNPTGGGVFRWFGDQIKAKVDAMIDARLHRTGEAVVARARSLAPVRTGALRNSIDYIVMYQGHVKTLVIDVGMPYGVFQEFGTRNIPPHPFIRPALIEAGRIWGGELQMNFAAPAGLGGQWHGLYAGTGKGSEAGFAASASHRWKPLTRKQKRHVEKHLVPSIKSLHRGNVKRTHMRVRHIS